jgi:hypothetical protein
VNNCYFVMETENTIENTVGSTAFEGCVPFDRVNTPGRFLRGLSISLSLSLSIYIYIYILRPVYVCIYMLCV